MSRKGGNEDQYNIRRRNFNYQPEGDEDQRQIRQNRGRPRPQHHQQKQGYVKKVDPFLNNLYNIISQTGNGSRRQQQIKKKAKDPIKIQYSKKTTNCNHSKWTQPKYQDIKVHLDDQLEDYHKGALRKGDLPERSDKYGRREEYNFNKPNKKNQQVRIQQEDCWISTEQKVQPSKHEDSSMWVNQQEVSKTDSHILDGLDLKDTSATETNPNQAEKRVSRRRSIDIKKEKAIFQEKQKEEGDHSRINQQMSQSNSKDESISLSFLANIEIKTDPHGFSTLLKEQNFIENIIDPPTPKKQLLPLISQEQLRKTLQTFQTQDFGKVVLKFQSEENILEIRIRQVELIKLGITVKIHSSGTVSIKHYPSFDQKDIDQFVKFKEVSHFYPRIFVNQPENMPLLIEGDQQNQPKSVREMVQLQLCQVRGGKNIGQRGNLDKSVVQILLVMVKCMQCDTKNEITVIQNDSSVAGSCHSCSARILGKIAELWIE